MLNDAALVVGATAIKAAITHVQLHSTNAGSGWTANTLGARIPIGSNFSIDADGDITIGPLNFTGLAAGQAVGGASYWGALTNGTNYGGGVPAGDATANSAGEYTLTAVENSTAT